MGRHAADRAAPISPAPEGRGKAAGPRRPQHADLFAPKPGGTADRAAAERTAEAFDRLVEPHRSGLREYILHLTDGDDAVAESVLKETLYRVAQEPERYLQRPLSMRPWLVLTACAVVRDGERHAPAGHDDRPLVPLFRKAVAEPPPPVPASRVVAAMKSLSAEHRDLIGKVFYGKVTVEAVAAERGVPVRKVKSELYFAMRSLKEALPHSA